MTWRNWRCLLAVALAAVVLQEGIVQQLTVGGAHADLFLLLAVAAGLAGGAQRGAVVGFLLGLVADLFVPTPYGLSALCYVLVAFAVGLASALPGERPPRLFTVVTCFAGGVLGTLLYAGLLVLIGQPHIPRSQLTEVVIVVSVASAILALPATAAMRWALAGPAKGARPVPAAARGALR